MLIKAFFLVGFLFAVAVGSEVWVENGYRYERNGSVLSSVMMPPEAVESVNADAGFGVPIKWYKWSGDIFFDPEPEDMYRSLTFFIPHNTSGKHLQKRCQYDEDLGYKYIRRDYGGISCWGYLDQPASSMKMYVYMKKKADFENGPQIPFELEPCDYVTLFPADGTGHDVYPQPQTDVLLTRKPYNQKCSGV